MFPFLNKQPTSCSKLSFLDQTAIQRISWLTASTLLFLATIPAPVAAQVVLFDETFANQQVGTPGNVNSSPNNFNFGIGDTPTGSPPSDPPCLTAANPVVTPPTSGQGIGIPPCRTDTTSPTPTFIPDPAGSGTLRLTPSKQNQAAFVLVRPNGGISSADGLVITFDFFTYNGSGADGISFFLIDATANPVNAGAFGGSLGYANRTSPNTLPGVVGGYVGVGFDEFGNYSNGNEGRNGGSPNPSQPDGRVPDAVAVRGSQASGYRYISGTSTLPPAQSIDRTNATNRLTPGVQRTARITLTPDNQISVDVDFKDGAGFVNQVSRLSLNQINGQGSLPPSLNFGFAGSTGTSTNIHEIQNIRITTIPPDLKIVKTGPPQFTVGKPGAYTLNVANSPSAGSTSGAITVTDTLPPGFDFVSATGTNWTCSAVNNLVTCTYTGSPLRPAASAPPITINVLPTGALGNNPTATNTAKVDTPGDTNPGDNTTTVTTPIVAAPLIKAIKSSRVIDANGNGFADPGEVIAYTITIENQGNAPSTNTVFTDNIPANTTYVPNSSTLNNQAVADTGTSPFVNGSPVSSPSQAPRSGILNPGTPETATVQFQVRINNPLPAGVVQIQNQALIVSDQVREPPVLTNPPINTGPTINPVGPNKPLLRLVKRITGLNTTNYTDVIDENPALWPPTVQPVGRPDLLNPQTLVRSGDQVEYTIYFISAGSQNATNVQLCDAIPAGTTFINNSFSSNSGVLLNRAGTNTPLTNASDTDPASFLSPLAPVASPPCTNANNPNGSILLNLGDIPAGNAGFLRFRVKID